MQLVMYKYSNMKRICFSKWEEKNSDQVTESEGVVRLHILLPLSPIDERQQLEYGDLVNEKDMRRLLRYHRRAAAVLPRLLADGWEFSFVRFALWGEHEDVETGEEARVRLAILGVPLGWVEICGGRPSNKQDGGAAADPGG